MHICILIYRHLTTFNHLLQAFSITSWVVYRILIAMVNLRVLFLKCHCHLISSQVLYHHPLHIWKAMMGMNVTTWRLQPTCYFFLEDRPLEVGNLLYMVVDSKGQDAL